MGVPDEIVTHGNPTDLLAAYGLSPEGVAGRVKEGLDAQSGKSQENKRFRIVK